MLLSNEVGNLTFSNIGAVGEFKIKNSAKAFSILSSGLYSNKIRAIIRELSTNALDSHVGVGKADLPFEVHLPTIFEPWFAVRDFGMGLDRDQVVNIYTTYFDSTKTHSNDFIGALGLGSKSPFSYTENFTVTAIKNGIKGIYSAFINEMGVPSIAEMLSELTDEENGVEVKFSVTDRHDYNSFQSEARTVFKWFTHKPTIIGVNNFEHISPSYLEENIIPNVHVTNGRTCTAVMGNISYPLSDIPEVEKHFGELRYLLDCGLVLEFGIGDLDFAASREQLSYIPLTIKSIRAKLETLNDNLANHLAAKADAITNEWERAFFLYEKQGIPLYKSAVIKYVADTKFSLYDPKAYYGRKSFIYPVADLTARGLDLRSFRSSHGSCSKITEFSTHVNGAYVKAREISVDSEVVIVLNDLKTGCLARARYHYNNARKIATVFCVSHSSDDLTVRQVEYDKFVAELHNPPVIVKASELTKKERKTPVSTQGIATLVLKPNRRSGVEDAYTWEQYSGAIDEDETYYYVCLNNHDPITLDGAAFNIKRIKGLMDECGVSGISSIRIFGVRKNRINEIKKLDNWVWIEDILKEETAKISNEHIASLIATEILDNYYTKVYTSKRVQQLVGPDSDYAKYLCKTGSIARATGNVSQLAELCKMYGNTLQVDNVKNMLLTGKKGLYEKYPLLKYFKTDNDTSRHETIEQEHCIAEYIKLIDKQT